MVTGGFTLQKSSFAWSEGGEEGGGGVGGSGGGGGGAAGSSGNNSGGSAGGVSGTGTGASGNPASGGGGPGTGSASAGASGGLAHWVSVMAEHIHNPHSAAGVHHQQQSPPQAPYPWNNGLSTDVSPLIIFKFCCNRKHFCAVESRLSYSRALWSYEFVCAFCDTTKKPKLFLSQHSLSFEHQPINLETSYATF